MFHDFESGQEIIFSVTEKIPGVVWE
jgi:hypothetical protein